MLFNRYKSVVETRGVKSPEGFNKFNDKQKYTFHYFRL